MSQTNNNVVVERTEPLEVLTCTHLNNKTGSSPTPTRYNIDGASFGRIRPEGPSLKARSHDTQQHSQPRNHPAQ